MKKAVVAILAFLYMTIATGVVVNLHYCMGSIAAVDYGYNEQHDCGKCGMEMKPAKGCCHTESKIIKIDDAHQLVKATAQQFQAPALPVIELSSFERTLPEPGLELVHHDLPPPDDLSSPPYLLNRVFRI